MIIDSKRFEDCFSRCSSEVTELFAANQLLGGPIKPTSILSPVSG
jgi:hypothetical protein